MDDQRSLAPTVSSGLKIFSWVVLALMVLAIFFVGWLALSYWPAIRV